MVLAVVAATAAAWWPARTVARVSITDALSGRPQPPAPARQSAGLAGLCLAVGMACFAFSDRTSVLLLGTGAVALVVGVLLLSPLAIRLLTPAAGRLPIAMRLALRDLGRYQARSAAALAGISLSLGIPVALVITGSAAADAAPLGNVSDRQLVVWTRDQGQPEGVSPFYTVDPHDSGFSPYLPKLTEADLSAGGGPGRPHGSRARRPDRDGPRRGRDVVRRAEQRRPDGRHPGAAYGPERRRPARRGHRVRRHRRAADAPGGRAGSRLRRGGADPGER